MRLFVLFFITVLTSCVLAQGPAWGVAVVDDVWGMHLNPGYLGIGNGAESALFGYFSPDSLNNIGIDNSHGLLLNFGSFAGGYERHAGLYRWTAGLGAGDKTFGIGYLRTWSKCDAWDGGWKNGWIFGTLVRPCSFVSLGWSYQSPPMASGTHRFGIGLRPTSWRVTLFGDVAKPDDTPWEDFYKGDWTNKVYWGVGTELHLVNGIRLFGRYDRFGEEESSGETLDEISVGLRIDSRFGGAGMLVNSGSDDAWDIYSIYSIGSVEELPSIIPMPKRALRLDLEGDYVERPRGGLFFIGGKTFGRLLQILDKAAEDDEITGLVIRWRSPDINFAQAEELRAAIQKFSANDKPVLLYADNLGNLSYYLASAADYVAIAPSGGGVHVIGLRAELTYLKGTLDKLGITGDFISAGDYKSAPETFTRTEPSEFAAENINDILDGLERQFISGIAQSREMSVEQVGDIIDGGPYTDAEAESLGLIDTLCYWNEFENYVKEERDLQAEPIGTYAMREMRNMQWGEPDRIAIIVVDGSIIHGKGGSGGLFGVTSGDREIVAAIDAARKNKTVKGVLFRIHSGGGSAIASDLIRHALSRAAEEKPVIVSMGGAAASGGYAISVPGEFVFTDKATFTGSIGVFGGKFSLEGLYDKIGVTHAVFTRGENAGIYSLMDTFSVKERERYESVIMRYYDLFKGRVGEERNLPTDSVESIARGRVWLGSDAVEIGLADSIGGFTDALNYIIEETGVNERELELLFWPSAKAFMFPELLNMATSWIPFKEKLEDIPTFPYDDYEPLYLMPYIIEVK